MEYKELVNRVLIGEEFNFYYNNIEYWISNNEDGYYLTDVPNQFTQNFKTAESLFKEGKIENKNIIDIWNDTKI